MTPAIHLAAKLGIRITDAQRYLDMGLTELDIEICLDHSRINGIPLDRMCILIVMHREAEAQGATFVGTFNDSGESFDEFIRDMYIGPKSTDKPWSVFQTPHLGTIRRTKRFTSLALLVG
jgi:hypothetical protein